MARRKWELFDLFNYGFFLVVIVIMIYPFWHTIAGSFMTLSEYYRKLFLL